MDSNIPVEAFMPGEYIQDELDARGWTQTDLAQIMDRPLVAVNQIIKGKRRITPETAKGLAAAFGTSPDLWMNLESTYQLSQVKTEADSVTRRAKLYGIAPVGEMIKRGWIKPFSDVADLESALKRFFETDDLENIHPLDVAARKSASYDETNPQQRAWYYRARKLAKTIQVAEYDPLKLKKFLAMVRTATRHPENIAKLPEVLAKIGIRLVLLSHLEKSKIDGAAFWLDAANKRQPVVVLSLRFDRIDNFWHTLIHELVHIRDGESAIDSEIDVTDDEIEMKVNVEAAAILVPQEELIEFISRVKPLYSREKITQFGYSKDIHPGIVLGQLHFRREVPPKNLRDLLVPIRQHIVGKTTTDGWGHEPGEI